MYRQYENPVTLQERLEEAKAYLQELIESNADIELIVSASMEVHELKERVNFAWQDDEYDSYAEIEYSEDSEFSANARWDDMNYRYYTER